MIFMIEIGSLSSFLWMVIQQLKIIFHTKVLTFLILTTQHNPLAPYSHDDNHDFNNFNEI